MNCWNTEAQRVFRTMLVRSGVRRKQLVHLLAVIGIETTESAIANRLHRGTLTFAFVLQVARALGLRQLELDNDPILQNASQRAGASPTDTRRGANDDGFGLSVRAHASTRPAQKAGKPAAEPVRNKAVTGVKCVE